MGELSRDTIERLRREMPANAESSYVPPIRSIEAPALPGGVPPVPLSRWELTHSAADAATAAPRDGGHGATPRAPSPSDGGTVAGGAPFVLEEVVGAGGMGEVWRAVQVSLGRHVAVKRIRRDRDGGVGALQEELEFRQEAALTAQLDHPNIVPVYDLGADAAGSPLLAMKLVRGTPWNVLIARDFETLPPADLLARHLPIFIDMAQAVAFAHARGVVHRDLKPAQVMVGEFGEVLLTDWGLALSVHDGSGEGLRPIASALHGLPTRHTATNPSGTPAMMAPEQAEDTAERIGPWTDVFLLGGTLYHLLTGTYPHRARAPLLAIEEAIECAIEPPAERAPEREIPDELAAIAMRALQREPEDRLPSVAALVEAVGEFVSGTRRRHESEAIASEVDAAMGAGDPATDYGTLNGMLVRLDRAASLWGDNPRLAPLRDRVLERYGRAALATGDLTLARVQGERLGGGAAREALLGEVGAASRTVQRRDRQRRLTALSLMLLLPILVGLLLLGHVLRQREREQRSLVELLRAIGGLRRAEEALTRDLEHDVPIPELGRLGDPTTKVEPIDTARAAELIERRLALAGSRAELARRPGVSLDPPPPALQLAEANVLLHAATTATEVARATAVYDAAVAALPDRPEPFLGRAAAHTRAEDFARAAQDLERALALAESLHGPQHEEVGRIASLLGYVYRDVNVAEADFRRYFERSIDLTERRWIEAGLALVEQHYTIGNFDIALEFSSPTLAVVQRRNEESEYLPLALNAQGTAFGGAGRLGEAVAAFESAVEAGRRVLPASHHNTLTAQLNLAAMLAETGRLEEGVALARATHEELARTLGADHPRTVVAWHNVAVFLDALGRPDEAVEIHRAILALRMSAYPEDHLLVAQTKFNLAASLDATGALEEAARLQQEALASLERSVGRDHPYYAIALSNYADNLDQRGDRLAALKAYREALELKRRRFGPDHVETAVTLDRYGQQLREAGRLEESLAALEEGLAIRERVFGPVHESIALSLMSLSDVYRERGRADDALAANRRAIAIRREVLGPAADDTVSAQIRLASTLVREGRHEEAAAEYRALGHALEGTPGERSRNMILALGGLANAESSMGRHGVAEELVRRAVELLPSVDGTVTDDEPALLQLLGTTLSRQERHDEAEEYMRRGLELYRERRGPTHPSVARAFEKLADAQRRRGDRGAEAASLREALAIALATDGAVSAAVGSYRLALARCLHAEGGSAAEAATLAREAAETFASLYGEEDKRTVNARALLAEIESAGVTPGSPQPAPPDTAGAP